MTKYLLSGLVRCGRCGERMFASPYQPRYGDTYMIYRCAAGSGHLVRKLDPVDDLVTGIILARLERPDAAKLFAPDVDLDRLRRRATDLRKRRDAIAAMVADGLVSTDAGREHATKLTAELVDVTREIDSATDGGPLAPLANAENVRATWSQLDLLTRRAIIDMLVTVTIQPVGKGSGGFDPKSVEVGWRS